MGSGGSSSPRSFRLDGEVVNKRNDGAFSGEEDINRTEEFGGLGKRVLRGRHNDDVRALG